MKLLASIAVAATLAGTAALAQTMPDPTSSPSPTGTDWAAEKARYEAEAAAYNAAAAAATARSAMIAAQTAADRASIGSVTGQTAIDGSVATASGTGQAEATLLVTRSMTAAAAQIWEDLKNESFGERPVLILTSIDQLSTVDAIQFQMQQADVGALLAVARQRYLEARTADDALPNSLEDGGTGDRMAALTAAGAVIDVASKLGSYFLSNYSFQPVTIDAPSQLAASAVVSAARARHSRVQFIIPGNFLASDAAGLLQDLKPLQDGYGVAIGDGAAARARSIILKEQGDEAARVAQLYDAAEASATRAITAFETMRTALAAVTPEQGSMASRIIRQQQIQQALSQDNSPLILLLSHKEAGALYTRKNLWTFIGGAPLYTMGGVSVTYSLFEPDTGYVRRAGIVARHGGYRSVSDVERLFPGQ